MCVTKAADMCPESEVAIKKGHIAGLYMYRCLYKSSSFDEFHCCKESYLLFSFIFVDIMIKFYPENITNELLKKAILS